MTFPAGSGKMGRGILEPYDAPPPPPPPPPPDCGITDTFTRTVVSGWGNSDAGPPWSLYHYAGTYTTSVDGERGVISHAAVAGGFPYYPSTVGFKIPASLSGNWDVYFTFTASAMGDQTLIVSVSFYDGATWKQEFDLMLYDSSFNDIGQGTIWFWDYNGDYTWDTVWAANTEYRAHIHYDSATSTSMARVWPLGASEPTVWHATNPLALPSITTVEFGSSVRYSPGVPITVTFENIDITDINSCAHHRFDNFLRLVTGGWGTSDAGVAWSLTSPGNVVFSADGNNAKAVFPQATISLAPYKPLALSSGPWQDTSFTLETRFQLTLHDQILVLDFEIENSGSGDFAEMFVNPWADSIGVQNIIGATSQYVDTPFTFADGWYLAKWLVTPTETSLKVWAEADAEPGWLVVAASAPMTPDLFTCTPQGRYHATGGNAVIAIDYVDFI